MSIYGKYEQALFFVMDAMTERIKTFDRENTKAGRGHIYEHLEARVKANGSMREKCDRKGLPQNEHSALAVITDSVGIRVICNFIDDIYRNVSHIKGFDDVTVVEEKDYIKKAKPNGYRSYHMIVAVLAPYKDIDGNLPGRFFVLIQRRTISMVTWASLEHEMKYKRDVKNAEMITSELKRCADELASCDISLQTLRDLIREDIVK